MSITPHLDDPKWLDVQYNNRARIPEHPQIFARWEKVSTLSREKISHRLDVRYGSGPFETLDIFPTTKADAPVLVFVHGGYWRSLDKRDHSFIAPSFVHDGAMVVIPNYALCPAVSIATIALQMVSALAWTYRHAALYGGDPKRIVVVGHSAGGHLAAMLLCCQWSLVGQGLPRTLVRSAISISGVHDLLPVSRTPFLKDDLRLTPTDVRRLSVSNFPRPSGTLFTVAGALESEEFLRQNELLRNAWGARTVPVCETIPGANHLDVLHDLAAPKGRLHKLALTLLGLWSPKNTI
jgi:arylformamidase